jgi:hypothetical protein
LLAEQQTRSMHKDKNSVVEVLNCTFVLMKKQATQVAGPAINLLKKAECNSFMCLMHK